MSSRTRACTASTKQDGEVRASEPQGWRNAQRGVHAAQPQRCVRVGALGDATSHNADHTRLHPTADDNATIRVTNLSEDTRETDLQELFRPFGAISRIYLAKDKNTGQSKVGAGLDPSMRQLSTCVKVSTFFLAGICFHQFPSAGGRIQSHRRSVRIWIRSPYSQCWMGQVRVISHCLTGGIYSCLHPFVISSQAFKQLKNQQRRPDLSVEKYGFWNKELVSEWLVLQLLLPANSALVWDLKWSKFYLRLYTRSNSSDPFVP